MASASRKRAATQIAREKRNPEVHRELLSGRRLGRD